MQVDKSAAKSCKPERKSLYAVPPWCEQSSGLLCLPKKNSSLNSHVALSVQSDVEATLQRIANHKVCSLACSGVSRFSYRANSLTATRRVCLG